MFFYSRHTVPLFCFFPSVVEVRHPNCYGIDLPRQSELLAHGLEEDEIAEAIGADEVVFQVSLGACFDSQGRLNFLVLQ